MGETISTESDHNLPPLPSSSPPSLSLPQHGHEPVLLEEILGGLDLRPGQTVVDCTLGRGGHAAAMGRRIGPGGLLIGMDADERNLQFAAERLKGVECRTRLFHANFAELSDVLVEATLAPPAAPPTTAAPSALPPSAILADLGLSTNQLFDERYGLSFDRAMTLDMRIDARTGRTAADLVNSMGESELANVLYNLAQERYSRRIARKIVEARRISPILDTQRLAEIVRRAVPRQRVGAGHARAAKIDPATRTFLALRMAVNREVENLADLLRIAPAALAASGRLAVISFQSTEDRVVKQAFAALAETGRYSVVTKKPVTPTPDEIGRNPRSRSAKLRIVQRK
jgi:16S rRNA (cytosine1402-N4)-methyltransferase